jgi:uncharacterized protein YndB with AHSA1/START domain
VDAPPAAVWAVLSDGWFYATWVVGASRVRAVDATWPGVGSQIHHSFGVWPAVIDDTSEVLAMEPERLLALKARGWPMGEAEVRVELEAVGTGTRVSIREDATAGPGQIVPQQLRQALIAPRNAEALKRLGYIAAGRSGMASG